MLNFLIFASTLSVLPCAQADEKPAAPPALAHLKLSGDLGDRPTPEMPFGRPPLTYRGFLQVLERAQADPRIRGVVLEVKELAVGMAKVESVLEALQRLRGSGKKLYVYAEDLSLQSYLVSSAADRVSMPEGGMILMPGVGAQAIYLKGLFAILGIEWTVVQEKDYKTAFESFIRDSLSPEQREVLNSLLDQYQQLILEKVSAGRRMPPEKVQEAIDEAVLLPPRALELGLLDAVEYRDQFEAALRQELGADLTIIENYGRGSREIDMNNPLVAFAQIMKILSPTPRRREDASPKIAIVYAEGIITSGKSRASPFGGAGSVGSDTLVKALEEAAGDDSVKAIVLRVDSPGGSGLASDVIWRAVARVREKKPVIASMGDTAASGGYYISMGANWILAQSSTITGSIGVIAARPSVERLLGFWGVRTERLQRSKNAGLFDVFQSPTDSEREALHRFVAGFYDVFVAKAAQGRGIPVEEMAKLARGRVWTGAQAKERGLVDEIGGFERALELAREKGGIPEGADPRVVEYPPPPDFFESLSEMLEMRALASAAGRVAPAAGADGTELAPFLAGMLPELRPALQRLWELRLLTSDRVLALLPLRIDVR